MTIRELEQLKFLKGEAAMLQSQIDGLQQQIDSYIVRDCVKASSAEFPYTAHTLSLRGISEGAQAEAWESRKQLIDLRRDLQKKRDERNAEYDRLTRYIQSVDDSLIRQIMTYRFVKGYEWAQVAKKINKNYTRDQVRIMVNRFLAKK